MSAAVLGLSGACSSAVDTTGWTTRPFDGGSVALPPSWSPDAVTARDDALLSLGTRSRDDGATARVDVYRERPPVLARRGGDEDGDRDAALGEVRCPGGEVVTSEQLEVDGTTVAVNVFERDLTAGGAEGTTLVCASYATAQDAPNVQLVLRGDDDALPEGLWRAVLASADLAPRG